jgi:hypothetical protein
MPYFSPPLWPLQSPDDASTGDPASFSPTPFGPSPFGLPGGAAVPPSLPLGPLISSDPSPGSAYPPMPAPAPPGARRSDAWDMMLYLRTGLPLPEMMDPSSPMFGPPSERDPIARADWFRRMARPLGDDRIDMAQAETPSMPSTDLILAGASSASAAADQAAGASTNQGVVVRLPNGESLPDAQSPTGSVMSPVGDLNPVAAAGRQAGETYFSLSPTNPETELGAAAYLAEKLLLNLGHAGTFDYQREGNSLTGFTQLRQFRPVSKVNVGLFCQQAGLSLEDTLAVAGAYARIFSKNAKPDRPSGLDPETEQFTRMGYELGQSGVFGPPARP